MIFFQKEENEKGIVRSGYSKNLSVPIYQQVGHSNCGAASGRMVLKYKTGKDYGEDTLATAMEIPKYNFAYVYMFAQPTQQSEVWLI